MLKIAIQKGLNFTSRENLFLNTNSEKASELAQAYDIQVFKREEDLCTNETTLDTIIYNFVQNNPCKKVILINTITPLLNIKYLSEMFEHFENESIDSLISGNKFKLHAFCNNKAVNFENKGPIPQTQNISSVDICNWGFGIWNTKNFLKSYETNSGHGVFSGQFKIYQTDLFESLKISEESDFQLALKQYKKLG